MGKKEYENIIRKILKENAGDFGMRAKMIESLLPENVDLSSYKVGTICRGSECIDKVKENSRGSFWGTKE